MLPYICEFIGTCMLIVLGLSACCSATLDKSAQKGIGALQVNIAWGLAVMIPAFIFGEASGAHFNPALTIALAVDGTLEWSKVLGYILCQFGGAFLGACIVYLLFKGMFDATDCPEVKRACFVTGPSVDSLPLNIFQEFIATFILVFSIKGISRITGLAPGVDKLLVFGIICAMGMCMASLTGAALNPARDLAPRIAHALLPIKNKADSNWKYGLIVPIVGPLLGALSAVLLYGAIPW